MLAVGSRVTNARSGTEFEFLELSDTGFVLKYTTPEARGVPDVAAHVHKGWTEEFRMIEGSGTYRLGGEVARLETGESITMPEGVPHVHPMSVGPGRMVMEQHATLTAPTPDAVRNTFGVLFSLFEWEAEGRIALDKVGLPRHPMKFALAGRLLGRAGGYDARLPMGLQDFAGATVGWLAERLGYSVIDPKWR